MQKFGIAKWLFSLIAGSLLSLSGLAQGLPPPSSEAVAAAIAAQERHTNALMAQPGVVGTAVGLGSNGVPVIKVFLDTTASSASIPTTLDGIPVVPKITGLIVAQQFGTPERRTRLDRPVPIGTSAGHTDITAGTIGCLVSTGCHTYALSNAHVFADENSGQPGDEILQPGDADGGSSPRDVIGYLHSSIPIQFAGDNRVDAAIAMVGDNVRPSTLSSGYGTPRSEVIEATLGMNVMKFGRTTGFTHGRVDSINATINVTYDGGTARFVEQIGIASSSSFNQFSDGGDSGSLIVAEGGAIDRRPVALLFAGSTFGVIGATGETFANPIQFVLDELGGENGPDFYIVGE